MSLELVVIIWLITIMLSVSIGILTSTYAMFNAGIKSRIPTKLRTPCRTTELYIIVPFVNIYYSIVFLIKTIQYYRENK